ncbi:MAG: universal stress protein [Chloroflexi bacterium]|nr:universal stress protein [Chloroflexota bacterium]
MATDILIVTNGYKETRSAIEQGAWLAATLDEKVTLLGVTETLGPAAIDDHHPLEDVFERAVGLFKERGAAYSLEVRNGSADEVIPQRAKEGASIVVLGPLGRPQIRRLITGRSIRHFIEEIEQPILYVPRTVLPVRKILICMGGLGYEVTAENLAMQIALKSRAEITLLHIVPPMDLDYPTARARARKLAAPRPDRHAGGTKPAAGAGDCAVRRVDRQRDGTAGQCGGGDPGGGKGRGVRPGVHGVVVQRAFAEADVFRQRHLGDLRGDPMPGADGEIQQGIKKSAVAALFSLLTTPARIFVPTPQSPRGWLF